MKCPNKKEMKCDVSYEALTSCLDTLFNSKLFASDVWLKTFWLVKFQTFCLNFLLVRASDQTAPRRHHRRRRSKVERDNKESADSQSLGESGALRHVRRHPPSPSSSSSSFTLLLQRFCAASELPDWSLVQWPINPIGWWEVSCRGPDRGQEGEREGSFR